MLRQGGDGVGIVTRWRQRWRKTVKPEADGGAGKEIKTNARSARQAASDLPRPYQKGRSGGAGGKENIHTARSSVGVTMALALPFPTDRIDRLHIMTTPSQLCPAHSSLQRLTSPLRTTPGASSKCLSGDSPRRGLLSTADVDRLRLLLMLLWNPGAVFSFARLGEQEGRPGNQFENKA